MSDLADARTTPRSRQVAVLFGVAALAWYFLSCIPHAMADEVPYWAALGNWRMFTTVGESHQSVVAEVDVGGEWLPVDLEALFPSRWESGPRYARPSFAASKTRMQIFAAAVCSRDPRGPQAVRFEVRTWPVITGRAALPPYDVVAWPLLQWPCNLPSPVAHPVHL